MPRAESKSMDSAASSAQSAETKTEEKQDFDENELLMYVAADANEHLFGEKSELTQFVNAHAADFETALDGDRTGAGTPIKQAERWRSAHAEYNEIMEEILEALVKKNNGTIEAFMKDVQCALAGGEGFLFEDDNYSEFVERIQAMDDYETARARRPIRHRRDSPIRHRRDSPIRHRRDSPLAPRSSTESCARPRKKRDHGISR